MQEVEEDKRRWWILAVLCLSVFLVTVDNTIVNVALPTLGRELDASTSALQWVVDAYVLVFAGLMLAAGGLGDKVGRKRTLQFGLVIFAIASFASAGSTTVNQLIGARAFMGVGAALIYPATLALIATVFTNRKEKATAIGIWSGVTGLAIALGPVAGGLLLEKYYWGSLFLVNLPVIAVALLAGALMVPESKSSAVGKFDKVGAVGSLFAVGLLIWTIIEAPKSGWASTITLAGFAGAAILLIALIWWESRASSPLLDVTLFRNARFSAASASIAVAFFGLFGFIFLITQYFQAVRGYGVLQAGLATLPFAFVVAALSPVAILIMKSVGTKLVVSFGLLLMSFGFIIAAIVPADAAYWGPIVSSMVLMAAGLALVSGPATDAIMGALQSNQAGAGAAVNDTTREFGGALGVAVLGSLMSSSFQPNLLAKWEALGIPPDLIGHGQQSVMASLAIAADFPPDLAFKGQEAASEAFMSGLHAGSLAAAVLCAVAAAGALFALPGRDV